MKQINTLLFTAILVACITTIKAQTNVDDSLALVDLYNSTDGSEWFDNPGWLAGPVKTWYGITIENDRVIEIELEYNRLTGSIPETIGNLTSLKVLELGENHLKGNIPASIGNLLNLTTLSLFHNHLSGSIPNEICNLSNLIELNFYSNKLSGSIPEDIGNLSALEIIDFAWNQLNGPLPESLGNLSSLTYLNFSSNELSSNIPETIGNLSKLKTLILSYNHLKEIPESIGNLFNLDNLTLSFDELEGTIPESIGNLANLKVINLSHNELKGKIPESVGNLKNLEFLFLSNNEISDSMPESIGDITNLKSLSLEYNQLYGNIPATISKLGKLEGIYLSFNYLTGNVPDFIGNPLLQSIYLNNNQLTGNLPEIIGHLLNLAILNVSHNLLSGQLPSSFTNSYLYNFDISNNKFRFDGLEEVVQSFSGNYLSYAPQANIPLMQNGNQLSVSAGGTLANNTYYWYKDSELIAIITDDSTFTITEDGTYNVNVENYPCYELTLYSDTITTSVLPLTFLNFTATLKRNTAFLDWTTANEINTSYFNVQRSTDGVHFNTIGKVYATGSANSSTNYNYIDAAVSALRINKIYYRLQQTDKNGSYTYSKIITLNVSGIENSFTVFPNPVKDILHIKTDSKTTFILATPGGKIILKRMIDGEGEIDIASLSAGLYYLKSIATGEVKKIVVK